jgi:septin family protein
MHTVEVLATTQQPMLMVGEVASGKSSFMKDFMNSQIYQYAKDVSTEHVTCSYHLDSVLFKEYIENHLEQKKPEKKIIDQEASKLSLNSSKKLPFATNNSSLQLLPNINMTPGPEDRSAFNATNLT